MDDVGKPITAFLKSAILPLKPRNMLVRQIAYCKRKPKHARLYKKRCIMKAAVLSRNKSISRPELNTLIGIRGSGSLQSLNLSRYALDIPSVKNAGR